MIFAVAEDYMRGLGQNDIRLPDNPSLRERMFEKDTTPRICRVAEPIQRCRDHTVSVS